MALLSVAIITLNEQENLPRTLESVKWADEIVIVDSGSTDRTVDIAREYSAKVIHRDWSGFASQKNFAISQCTGQWILSLDADEELTEELQTQIRHLLPTNPPVDAFFLARRNMFLGRWIQHGGFYPDPKLRLFRCDVANFASTPQFQERPVHETITFDGASAQLDYDLIHHAYPTLCTYIEHMDRYSSLGADLLIEKGRPGKSWLSFIAHTVLAPHFTFIWNYVFRFGFLDGREGLLLHLYHTTYTSWKYAKAWEKGQKMARELEARAVQKSRTQEAA